MSNQTLNRMLDDFYPYAKEYLGFDKDAKISFASDKNNANKPLGKTAYYDPSNYSVTVYTDNRHPKDIMRSVSHELVHHAQNCRGDLNMSEDTGEGYAQNNEHLREMEREAYEKGNLCFRDWEDGIKSNLEPGTIYESRARRSKKSMNNFKTLNENFKKFLKEDWQDDPMGGMSSGDSEQYETLVRDTIEDILEMEGTSIQAIQSPMQLARLVGQVMQQPGVEESGLDEDAILGLIDDMQQGMMQEEEAGYKDGQEVEIVGGVAAGKSGTVKEPMAGGAVIELEDGKLVKVKDEFIEKPGYSSGEPMNEARMGEYGKIDAEDGNPPSKIGRGNPEYMEAYNAVLIARGEEPLDVQQPDQAYLDALRSGNLEEGGVDWEAYERMQVDVIKLLQSDTSDGFSVDDIAAALGISAEQDMLNLQGALEELVGDGMLETDTQVGMYNLTKKGQAPMTRDLYHDKETSKPMQEGASEPKQGDDVKIIGGALTGAEGEVMELTTTTQGSPAVVVYLRKDADMKVYGKAGDEVIVQPKFVEVDRGVQGDDSVEPEDDYNWVGHKAHYQEGTDVTEEYNGHLWENKIDKIVDMVMKEYGDHETQAQGGMVSSTYSSDPEMDQVADIAATVAEQGGALMQIATALKDQGFSASLRAGVLMVDDKYFIGKPAKFDIGPDEPVQEVGPYVVGMMDNQMEEGMSGGFDVSQIQSREDEKYGGMIHMLPDIQFTGDIAADMQSAPAELLSWLYGELESGDSIQDSAGRVYSGSDVQDVVNDMPDEMFAEGESRHNTPDFFDSDEEKEMMKKMSNKEFYDYVTRDKHTTANLRDEPSMGGGGPIDGMEGPFQYKSGAVLYYDPKEGKYYDRSRDQYLDNEEAAKLTMENTQMKLKNVSLREKVKNSVMSKLKEMYDDDDMYGDEDPYMASLEAEFPWMKDDKKGGKMSKADLAAMQAAEKDAEMDPDMMAQMQAGLDDMAGTSEDDDDPVVTMKEDDVDFAEALRTRVLNRIQEMSLSEEEEEQESTEKHDDDPALKGDQDELPDDLQAAIIDKADDEGEKKEESLRDKVYRIVQETLNEEEHEDDEKEEVEEGKYKREKDDDEKEEQNESEEAEGEDPEADEDKEEVEENIAANPEDFFRKLRNESRTIKQDNWNDSHRSKRSSMLNERLMKSWFNK